MNSKEKFRKAVFQTLKKMDKKKMDVLQSEVRDELLKENDWIKESYKDNNTISTMISNCLVQLELMGKIEREHGYPQPKGRSGRNTSKIYIIEEEN